MLEAVSIDADASAPASIDDLTRVTHASRLLAEVVHSLVCRAADAADADADADVVDAIDPATPTGPIDHVDDVGSIHSGAYV
jgi:hypothetical protein